MIFNLIFVAYWSLAAKIVYEIYQAIEGFQNHDLVDRDEEFFDDGPTWRPSDEERDYNDDIASGLSANI